MKTLHGEYVKKKEFHDLTSNTEANGQVAYGEKPFRWIQRLLEEHVADGRKRVLWLILAPCLINIQKLRVKDAAPQYLALCNKKRSLGDSLL